MACISISIGHKTSGGSQIIYYNATDGIRNLYGDQAFGWGGMGTPTDEEYKLSVTPYILSWFNKPETELCSYVPPVPPPVPPIIPGTDNNVMVMIIGFIIVYYFLQGK